MRYLGQSVAVFGPIRITDLYMFNSKQPLLFAVVARAANSN
jgi:hypothetical protein